jgi:hypothetical protein
MGQLTTETDRVCGICIQHVAIAVNREEKKRDDRKTSSSGKEELKVLSMLAPVEFDLRRR